MIPDRVFVTGTDTDVGKTWVSAAIVASQPDRVALKPVASGVLGTDQDDAPRIGSPRSPWSYPAPVSPHRAAPDDIPLDAVLAWIRERSAARMLVEGAGGWRVPLSRSAGFSDLARELGFPVLVVAADRLGALNHTLLTVEAIRRDGLDVCGVVLNDLGKRVPTNLDDLQRLLDVPVVPFERGQTRW